MLTATKIRLYPTADQEQLLAAQFGCARFVWNRALAMKRAAWQERKESLSCYTIKGMLPVWKDGEFPWLKDADSQVMQEVIRHLDRAYRNFFEKRARLPRFKKKHAARQSIAYPQRVKLDGNLAYLPKVGWVKAVVHREIVGKIKTVTVSRESTGKYYASILADDGQPEIAPLPHIERMTGIDLGLKDALVSSTGYKTGNPKPLRRALSNLKRKQQAMSRKIEAAKGRHTGCGTSLARTSPRIGNGSLSPMSARVTHATTGSTKHLGNWRTKTKPLPPRRSTSKA